MKIKLAVCVLVLLAPVYGAIIIPAAVTGKVIDFGPLDGIPDDSSVDTNETLDVIISEFTERRCAGI